MCAGRGACRTYRQRFVHIDTPSPQVHQGVNHRSVASHSRQQQRRHSVLVGPRRSSSASRRQFQHESRQGVACWCCVTPRTGFRASGCTEVYDSSCRTALARPARHAKHSGVRPYCRQARTHTQWW